MSVIEQDGHLITIIVLVPADLCYILKPRLWMLFTSSQVATLWKGRSLASIFVNAHPIPCSMTIKTLGDEISLDASVDCFFSLMTDEFDFFAYLFSL